MNRKDFQIFMGLTLLSVFGLTSCQDQGYLFIQKPVPVKKVEVTHQLKEMQGNSVVDIIWVIDNSGSMFSHQQNVIANTALFLSQFARSGNPLNWKMGLISTDQEDAPFVGFGRNRELTSSTPGNIQIFQEAVARLGTNGTHIEEGFDPLLQILRSYPDFVRPASTLAVIFVTDAKEQGSEKVQNVLTELSRYKLAQDIVSYGIFWTQDLGCPRNPGEEDWALSGSRYGDFIQATRGKSYALCSRDFGANLADLGKDLVSRVTTPRIFLDYRPRASTIRVLYRGKELQPGLPGSGGHWFFDQDLNAILFHDLSFAPGDNEEVEILYDEDNGVNEMAN